MKGLWVVMLAMAFSTLACAESLRLGQVLDRMVAAYGGEENLGKLDRAVQEWDFYAPARQTHGHEVRTIQSPDRLRVELAYPDSSETRILDGESAYAAFNGRPGGPVEGPQHGAMKLQLMRLYSPLVLRQRLGDLSLTSEGGLVALSLVDGSLRVDYLVNPESWRIEKVVGSLDMGGRAMRFLTEYSDFAVIDGVLVHRAENKYAGGVHTAKLKLGRIELDAPVDAGSFAH